MSITVDSRFGMKSVTKRKYRVSIGKPASFLYLKLTDFTVWVEMIAGTECGNWLKVNMKYKPGLIVVMELKKMHSRCHLVGVQIVRDCYEATSYIHSPLTFLHPRPAPHPHRPPPPPTLRHPSPNQPRTLHRPAAHLAHLLGDNIRRDVIIPISFWTTYTTPMQVELIRHTFLPKSMVCKSNEWLPHIIHIYYCDLLL